MIREAVLSDLDQIVRMGRLFMATTEYGAHTATNPEQMAKTVTGLIASPTGIIFVSEDKGGALNGMIGLVVFNHHVSGEPTAGEAFWWSELPGAGMRLLERGREWATERGATKLQLIQPVDNTSLGIVYERMGFKRVEIAWQLDLPLIALASGA